MADPPCIYIFRIFDFANLILRFSCSFVLYFFSHCFPQFFQIFFTIFTVNFPQFFPQFRRGPDVQKLPLTLIWSYHYPLKFFTCLHQPGGAGLRGSGNFKLVLVATLDIGTSPISILDHMKVEESISLYKISLFPTMATLGLRLKLRLKLIFFFWLWLITEGAPSRLQWNSSFAFGNHLFGIPSIFEINYRIWNIWNICNF